MVRNKLLDRVQADIDLFHARNPQGQTTQANGVKTDEEG
jgi:glycerol-3-phosphate acyltransferase PlsX